MQDAGSFRTVEINPIDIGNHAQFAKVEMRILALQRIESPGHLLNAHGQCPFPLGQLEPPAQVEITIRLTHGEHVRVQYQTPMLHAQETKREPGQLPPIERAYPD